MGQNINTANILAAMFIACGQDAVSVLESRWSHLTAELSPTSHDLTLGLCFPSLLVGTVGGGTDYPAQKEAFELIGCYGARRKWALAETVAAFALALDVGTISAIASNTFVASHERLARLANCDVFFVVGTDYSTKNSVSIVNFNTIRIRKIACTEDRGMWTWLGNLLSLVVERACKSKLVNA
jgi:hypothetical protein